MLQDSLWHGGSKNVFRFSKKCRLSLSQEEKHAFSCIFSTKCAISFQDGVSEKFYKMFQILHEIWVRWLLCDFYFAHGDAKIRYVSFIFRRKCAINFRNDVIENFFKVFQKIQDIWVWLPLCAFHFGLYVTKIRDITFF